MPQDRGSEKQGIVDHYSIFSNDKTNKIFKLHSYIKGEGNGNPLCILAWRVPWMEEPGGLQSMGSHRVRHDWSNLSSSSSSSYIKHFLETKKKKKLLFILSFLRWNKRILFVIYLLYFCWGFFFFFAHYVTNFHKCFMSTWEAGVFSIIRM